MTDHDDQHNSDDNQDAIKPWGGRFNEPTDAFVELIYCLDSI